VGRREEALAPWRSEVELQTELHDAGRTRGRHRAQRGVAQVEGRASEIRSVHQVETVGLELNAVLAVDAETELLAQRRIPQQQPRCADDSGTGVAATLVRRDREYRALM
jgi:hypothetical protein